MTSNTTDYSDLIPEYFHGILSSDMQILFEEELAQNRGLQMELEEFKEFQEFYQELADEPQADDAQFNAILSAIDDADTEKTPRLSQKKKSESNAMVNVLEFWDWLKSSVSIPWGVALVQAVAIVIFLFPGTNQDAFKTLSRSSGIDTIHSAISFNIVFQKSAQEKEIRKLLLSIGGSITSGPSAQGLYVIVLSSETSIPQVVEKLNDSAIVAFNKRAY